MCQNLFNDIVEVNQLIAFRETIPGLEIESPIYFDNKCSIKFTYRKDKMEYYFVLTPIIENSNVISYLMYDKLSLLNRDLIEFGPEGNFPYFDYFTMEGGLLQPKEITYNEALYFIQNIEMLEAYDQSRIFW